MRKALSRQQVSQSPAAVQRGVRKSAATAGFQSVNTDSGQQAAKASSVSLSLNSGSGAIAQRKQIESLQQSSQSATQLEKARSIQLKATKQILQEKADIPQRVEEEELLQGKFDTAQLAEEEELLQGKFEPLQLKEGAKKNDTGLPNNLKAGIEGLSGTSLDGVKVHYNSAKPAKLQAHAYAQGKNIHVASGQEKHLPHEAWHVVQQAQGRVRPTMSKGGAQINDDQSLETEADVQGAKAMQFKPEKGQQKFRARFNPTI